MNKPTRITLQAERKPTLLELRMWYDVSLLDLVRVSRVSRLHVWAMQMNRGITRQEAEDVMQAFNTLKSTNYTVEDIAVILAQENTR